MFSKVFGYVYKKLLKEWKVHAEEKFIKNY